jgi:hypothetical protein
MKTSRRVMYTILKKSLFPLEEARKVLEGFYIRHYTDYAPNEFIDTEIGYVLCNMPKADREILCREEFYKTFCEHFKYYPVLPESCNVQSYFKRRNEFMCSQTITGVMDAGHGAIILELSNKVHILIKSGEIKVKMNDLLGDEIFTILEVDPSRSYI